MGERLPCGLTSRTVQSSVCREGDIEKLLRNCRKGEPQASPSPTAGMVLGWGVAA